MILFLIPDPGDFQFPIISADREIAFQLGMIDPDEDPDMRGKPVTARAVFIIGPDKKMKLSFFYPATTGFNFDEIIRVVDSLQLTADKKVRWKCMEMKTLYFPWVKDLRPLLKICSAPNDRRAIGWLIIT